MRPSLFWRRALMTLSTSEVLLLLLVSDSAPPITITDEWGPWNAALVTPDMDSFRDSLLKFEGAEPPKMVTDVFLARSLAALIVFWKRSNFVSGS